MTDDFQVTLEDRDIDVTLTGAGLPAHETTHEAGGSDELDLSDLAIGDTLDLSGESLADGAQTIWDALSGEIPDSALGSIDNATLTNDTVTVAGNSVSLGGTTNVAYPDLSDTGASFPIPNTDLANSSLSVAGNNVSLGGATSVTYTDLSDTGTSFPIPNTDLANDTVTVAGNSVSLGGTTSVAYPDLSDTGASFPIPNTDLANDTVTVAGNSVSLGGTTNVAYGDLSDTGSFPISNSDIEFPLIFIDPGDGITDGGTIELGGSAPVSVDESYAFTWSNTHTYTASTAIDLGGDSRISNAPLPESAGDLASKGYVDNNIQGATDVKESVRVAPDRTIDLTSTTDPNPVDGITVQDGDRVLLKEQTDGAENGIYVATTATDPSTWTRSADADADAEVTSGTFTFVEEGNTYGGSSWIITTDDPITLGTTSISFAQFSSAGAITAGDGLDKAGQTLSVDASDITGSFVSDDGSNNIQVDIGRGLESDGTGSIQFDEDVDYTFSQPITVTDTIFGQTFSATNGIYNGFNGGELTVDDTTTSLDDPNNDTRFDADGSTTALIADDTTPVTIRDSVQSAPTVEYTAGTTGTFGLPGATLDVAGNDIFDSATGTTVWDTSADEIPDSALGTVDTSTLSADSVTVTAGDGLTSGGSVALGGSVSLDIEPADFAGTFLSDDGSDDLQVDIGRGLEDNGAGAIQFDEDTAYTFTSDQTFNDGLNVATGQSIEDGSETSRVELLSSNTNIFDDGSNPIVSGRAGGYTRIFAHSSQPIVFRDAEGGFNAVKYNTSTTTGTLELTNADLDLAGNTLTSSSGRITLASGSEDLTISEGSVIRDQAGNRRFTVAPDNTAVFDGADENSAFFGDTLTRFAIESGKTWDVFGEELNDQLIEVSPSPDGTSPGTLELTNADLDMTTQRISFQGTGSQSTPASAITWPDQGGGSDPTLTVSGGGEIVAYDDDGNQTQLT